MVEERLFGLVGAPVPCLEFRDNWSCSVVVHQFDGVWRDDELQWLYAK
jgi:hypothetical protein